MRKQLSMGRRNKSKLLNQLSTSNFAFLPTNSNILQWSVGFTFSKLDRRSSKIEIISLFQSRKTESLLKGEEEDEVATKLQAAFKAMQVCWCLKPSFSCSCSHSCWCLCWWSCRCWKLCWWWPGAWGAGKEWSKRGRLWDWNIWKLVRNI